MRITLLVTCLALATSSCSSSASVCEQQFERIKACVQQMPDCQTYMDNGLVDSGMQCDLMKAA